jgi:hypothetical protein
MTRCWASFSFELQMFLILYSTTSTPFSFLLLPSFLLAHPLRPLDTSTSIVPHLFTLVNFAENTTTPTHSSVDTSLPQKKNLFFISYSDCI